MPRREPPPRKPVEPEVERTLLRELSAQFRVICDAAAQVIKESRGIVAKVDALARAHAPRFNSKAPTVVMPPSPTIGTCAARAELLAVPTPRA
jgi:hypothetical protein